MISSKAGKMKSHSVICFDRNEKFSGIVMSIEFQLFMTGELQSEYRGPDFKNIL